MDLNLDGRKALITGGSRGIGYAIAKGLVEEGCAVQLVGRNLETLELARASLVSIGGKVDIHVCDITDPAAFEALSSVIDGDLDILVNNAGAIPRGNLPSLPDPAWRSGWELKVFGYINLARTVYARMAERRHGVILNIIGVGGERPTAAYLAGSTANAALMAFTCALGGESVDHGVRVLGINPGLVETDRLRDLLTRDAQAQLGDASRWRELVSTRPFGRAARPEEIAAVAVFMASDRASYVSGTVVTVDGGSTTRHLPL
jgi:3-oxoacyl-[acyl-carrier protein] reductase